MKIVCKPHQKQRLVEAITQGMKKGRRCPFDFDNPKCTPDCTKCLMDNIEWVMEGPHWIKVGTNDSGDNLYMCSECKRPVTFPVAEGDVLMEYRRCPWCGEKMEDDGKWKSQT